MKIGIIVFSKTNNTFSVAERLQSTLRKKGLEAEIEKIIPENDDPGVKAPVAFKNIPDVSPYDVVIFGSPVWAFSLAIVMKEYLKKVSALSGKKVYSFVTKQMSSKFTGGNKANRQIENAVALKKGAVENSFVISWNSKKREEEISDFIDEITKSL